LIGRHGERNAARYAIVCYAWIETDLRNGAMTDTYRLVFRGEVLEGQHKAIVKQRLGVVLKIDGERLDALFTGKAVTVRKSADADTAAKFQVAFKRAGARLRVVEIDPQPAPDVPAVPAATVPGLNLAPAGTLLHDTSTTPAPAPVDTSHLTLASPGTDLADPRPDVATAVLDLSHLTVAELGTDLHDEVPEPDVIVATPTWGIAKVGAMLAPAKRPVEPRLDVDAIDFDVAPPGTRLADENDEPSPPAPDTSHITLQ
jgi:hypothetical protein